MAPTPQQLILIAQAKRRRAENGAGLSATNPMAAQGQAAQREWRNAGSMPANPNPENPIITAQRGSQAQVNSAFHEERRPRTDAELAAVKSAKSAAFSRAIGEMGFAPDVMPTQSFDDQGNVVSMGELDKALPWRFGASAVNAAGPGSANAILEIGDAAFGPGLPFDYAGNELDFSKKSQPRITFGGDGTPEAPKPPRMLPTIPLTPARDAAEMAADFGGTLVGALAGPGKAIPKSASLGGIASKIGAKGTPLAKAQGFGVRMAGDAIENVGYAGIIGANMAPDGQRAEMAAEFMADPLNWAIGPGASLIYRGSIALKTMGGRVTPEYVRLQQAMQTLQSGRASPQQMQAAAQAVDELTPPDPQAATGAPAASPQSAPVAQPAIPQAAPRAAQAGPSGAGQGTGAVPPAGGAQPVLNATPAPAAGGQGPVAMAKSDARIIGRLLKAGGVARNDVNNLLAGLVQAYQGSNSSRLPLAFFAEEYLPTVLPKQTADDVIQKLRGFGRERYSANGPKDTSRSTMRNTVDTLRSTQQDNLSGVMDANLYKGKLIGQEDKLNAQLEQNARTAYTTALENANNRLLNGKATQAERDALGEIQALLHNGAFLKEVPAHLRIKAMRDGINLEDYVQKDPIAAAHWLQSELRQAVTAAEGVGGMATSESRLYGEMRTTLLEQLEKVVPGYLGARKAHGDIYGAKEAIEFGGNFFKSARSEVETARLARQFKAMSVRQKTAATMSIRDALKNEFRNKAEDTAAKVTRLQQAGVLDALETVLGADGKRVAEAIRNTVKENERIRAVDMLSGSNTADNLAQMEAAQEAVRSPVNKAIGSLGDNRSWAATLTGDALLAANGLPPLLTGGKIASSAVGKLGKPSAQKLASATKTLYDLPAQTNALAAPRKPTKVSGPRAPKPPPEQIQATLDDLLNQYSALDHRANPAAGQKLLRQIERLKKQLPTPNALATPPRPPVRSGFGSSKPLDMSEAGRMQRAREQGFDVETPWFHAGNLGGELSADAGELGLHIGNESAAKFVQQRGVTRKIKPQVSQLFVRGNYARTPDLGNFASPFQYLSWRDRARSSASRYADPRLRELAGRHSEFDPRYERMWDELDKAAEALPKVAEGQPAEAAWVKNKWRSIVHETARKNNIDGWEYLNNTEGGGEPSRVVFNPSVVRKSDATFDPSQSGSSKLLAGMGTSPEGLGAAAGGAAGYVLNPTDANGDGVIDDADRGLNAMGLMITGGLGVKAARMGVGAAKSGANALRDIGKAPELPKPPAPTPAPARLREAIATPLPDPNAPRVKAYHGTQHDLTGFDGKKIGTGQGAQTFGYGHYFAENPSVAQTYRGDGPSLVKQDGVRPSWTNPRDVAGIYLAKANGNVEEATAELARKVRQLQQSVSLNKSPHLRSTLSDYITAQAALMDGQASKVSYNRGNLYEVDLRVAPDEMFDLDKPFSQQPPFVQEALRKVEAELGWHGNGTRSAASSPYRSRDYVPEAPNDYAIRPNETGHDIMSRLGHDSPDAAEYLREAGIKGLRYLDQKSRDAGTGTSNFVILRDDVIDVVGKNGEPFGVGRPDLELTQRAAPPKPTQAGFLPSGSGKPGAKPPANALAGPPKPKPVEARREAPRGTKSFSDPRLSPGENKTAEMVLNGYTYDEIADEAMTSVDVIKRQAMLAQRKLGDDVKLPRPGMGKRPPGSTKRDAANSLFGEGLDNATIAQRTGLSIGNVRTYRSYWKEQSNAPVASVEGAAYNPPAVPARPFEADYPQKDWPDGPPVDAQGRLTRDMDRKPLDQNSVIIGRAKAPGNGPGSEADRSLRDRIAIIQTLKKAGSSLELVPRPASQASGGWRPNFDAKGRFTGRSETQIANDLDRPVMGLDDQEVITLSHELAHSIDFRAKPARDVGAFNDRAWGIDHRNPDKMPPESTAKVQGQLERIYQDLNNPVDGEIKIRSPKDQGYDSVDADRELWAEAIRAYMYDPNYIKTVAPDVAFLIRHHVNGNSSLRKTIQFNAVPTIAAMGGLGLGAAALNGQPAEAQTRPGGLRANALASQYGERPGR